MKKMTLVALSLVSFSLSAQGPDQIDPREIQKEFLKKAISESDFANVQLRVEDSKELVTQEMLDLAAETRLKRHTDQSKFHFLDYAKLALAAGLYFASHQLWSLSAKASLAIEEDPRKKPTFLLGAIPVLSAISAMGATSCVIWAFTDRVNKKKNIAAQSIDKLLEHMLNKQKASKSQR